MPTPEPDGLTKYGDQACPACGGHDTVAQTIVTYVEQTTAGPIDVISYNMRCPCGHAWVVTT